MLTAMRKGAGGWIARIFMGILVLSFAVWGIADFLTGAAQRPLAEVSGTQISGQEFNAEFRRELQRLQQARGADFDAARAREAGFDKEVLRQMIVRMMFDKHARELGLTTADTTVAQSIKEDANFKDAFGMFDRMSFNRTLQDNGFRESVFVQRIRDDMTRRQLIAAITSGAEPPKSMVEAVLRRYNEQRSAEVLFIPQTAIAVLPKPAESELEKFYQANAGLFTAPETRGVSFLTFKPDDLAAGIKISDEDLHTEYQARLADFTIIGMRNLEQFVLDDEAKANEAIAKLRAGADFHKIAKQYAGLEPDDLKLLEVTKQDLLPETADAIMALKERETGGPFKSPLGWQIVKITALREERIPGFAEVRDRLVKETALNRASDLMVELTNKLEDARAGGASLEEAAAEFGLKLRKIPQIDRDGNDAGGNPVAELPADPNFITDIFATNEDAESDLRENKEGGYYVIRVDVVTKAALSPLTKVRKDVESAWRAQRTGEELQRLADESLNQIKAGVALAKIAAQRKLKLLTAGPFGRDYKDDHLSAGAVTKLFAEQQGGVITSPAPQGGIVLARLSKISPPDLSTQAEIVAQGRKKLGEAMRTDILAQYQSVLERDYQVSINENQLTNITDEQ